MKNPQITKKIGSANHKTVKRHICGRFTNITNYLSLQICGFADHPPLLFGITFRLRVSLSEYSSTQKLFDLQPGLTASLNIPLDNHDHPSPSSECDSQRVLNDWRRARLSRGCMICSPHPAVSKLHRRYTGRLRKRNNLLTGGGGLEGGRGPENYTSAKKAWSSINHSILSGAPVSVCNKALALPVKCR
jgi:hypothetical protein